MLSQVQIIHYLSANKQEFARKYHLKKLGFFGSYARNEQTPVSDLDLLVEFEDNTPNLADIKEFLRNDMQAIFHIPIYAEKNI